MVFAGRHLGQRVAGGMADHVMVAHHPSGGGTGPFGAFQTFLDGEVHVVADPILLGELEVEDQAEIVRGGVQMLAAWSDASATANAGGSYSLNTLRHSW